MKLKGDEPETKILYRIRPKDKKSIELFYDVYRENPDGSIVGWSVTELYRWGQGFVEEEDYLPYSDSRYVIVDPNIGDGCELDDQISIDFAFDDELTDEEKKKIEKLYCEGDEEGKSHSAWLFDGFHNWNLEDERVTIYGPFEVDKLTYKDYNLISEEPFELKSAPPIDENSTWPFK